MSQFYDVGKIVNTQGLKGEVRIISVTDFPEERYRKGAQLTAFPEQGGSPVVLTVASYRRHKQFDIVSFENYQHINLIEPLKGAQLKVAASDLQALDEDTFYYHEIIGLTVQTTDGNVLGTIVEILSPAANDVWVVQPTTGKKQLLIPYIDDVVKRVDTVAGVVTIEVLEGLLD